MRSTGRINHVLSVQQSDSPIGLRANKHPLVGSQNAVTRFPDDSYMRALELARPPRVGKRRPKGEVQPIA